MRLHRLQRMAVSDALTGFHELLCEVDVVPMLPHVHDVDDVLVLEMTQEEDLAQRPAPRRRGENVRWHAGLCGRVTRQCQGRRWGRCCWHRLAGTGSLRKTSEMRLMATERPSRWSRAPATTCRCVTAVSLCVV